MKKITIERKCTICKEIKRTTNTEEPFVCETPCLRIKGRELLLKRKEQPDIILQAEKTNVKRGFWICLFILLLGILIGYLVMKYLV